MRVNPGITGRAADSSNRDCLTPPIIIHIFPVDMTAEIVVMNRQAVAMAADSAVTVQRPLTQGGRPGQKVYLSANKIFALSRVHPVGIMVYGNSTFVGLPWETAIKEYRAQLRMQAFPTTLEYSTDFFSFVEKSKFVPEKVQEDSFKASISGYCRYVVGQIRLRAGETIRAKGSVSLTETRRIISRTVNDHYRRWRDAEYLPSARPELAEAVRAHHEDYIQGVIHEEFQELPLAAAWREKLILVCSLISSKLPDGVNPPNYSGVVFAGYGDNEMFPSLWSFIVGDIYRDVLHYRCDQPNCLQIGFEVSAGLAPFAQRDVVQMFVSGLSPKHGQFIDRLLRDLAMGIPEEIIDSLPGVAVRRKAKLKAQWKERASNLSDTLRDELRQYRRAEFEDPVVRTVTSMPRDELAAMAEALVNLTSFSRKVTKELETVGGPVDVAVISKGDGFVWINRKHYFKPELNPQFFSRCSWEVEGERHEEERESDVHIA